MFKFLLWILKAVIAIVVAGVLFLFLLNKGCEREMERLCEKGHEASCALIEDAKKWS